MTQSSKVTRRPGLRGRTRVRLEYTATPVDGGTAYKTDQKLGLLKVLLRERFGEQGEMAYRDWLLITAMNQSEKELVNG